MTQARRVRLSWAQRTDLWGRCGNRNFSRGLNSLDQLEAANSGTCKFRVVGAKLLQFGFTKRCLMENILRKLGLGGGFTSRLS